MKTDTIGGTKKRARRWLASMPFAKKIDALICLQRTARDMAHAAGRPFKGTVWPLPKSR